LHPWIEKPMLDGQAEPPPDRNPSCAAAEESGRRLARAVLESMDAIKPGETPQIRSRLVNRLKRAWQSRRSMAARRDLQCTTIGGLQRIHEGTFARTRGNDGHAPIAAVRRVAAFVQMRPQRGRFRDDRDLSEPTGARGDRPRRLKQSWRRGARRRCRSPYTADYTQPRYVRGFSGYETPADSMEFPTPHARAWRRQARPDRCSISN
jgi:hypothetical protein